MNGYSKDLRLKMLDAIERGTSRREVASLFGVSLSTIKCYVERRREGGDLSSPKLSPGRTTPRILAAAKEKRALWAQSWKPTTRCHPGASLRAVGGGARREGVSGDNEPRREEARVDLKKSLVASKRDEGKRRAWRERLRGVDPGRLVFVDESSTNVALTTRYARAPKGERASGKAPRGTGARTSR